jgi:hypothetical protein
MYRFARRELGRLARFLYSNPVDEDYDNHQAYGSGE